MINKIYTFLKGLAMGAADVVPGVSGGTIAFITGIYEDLVASINAINLKNFKLIFKGDLKGFWKAINGSFVLPLALGIGIAYVSLARVIKELLHNHEVLVWSFFFGLILASIWLVFKMINNWGIMNVLGVAVGTIIAYYLSIMTPVASQSNLWFIFLAGAIAICAMILPGISGSFILLLLGAYELIIGAISGFNIPIIAVFALGCAVGLLSFSRFLEWLLKNYYDITIAVLLGFLIGSLNKIWPWKHTVSTRLNSHGEVVPFIQENVWPTQFSGNPNIVLAIVFLLVGMFVILALSYFGKTKPKDI